MQNLKKILVYFFKSKWTFKKPNRKKVLIYDGVGSELILQHVYRNDCEIYYNRGEFINLYVLFYSIYKNGIYNIRKNYKKSFFNFVKPKIVITFIDNNPAFYKLKKEFPEMIFLSIQNGIRTNRDFIDIQEENKTNLVSDYFLTFSENYSRRYAKFIKAKFIPIGSFKLNLLNLNCSEKKDILFISKHKKPFVPFTEYKIIDFLIKYCKEKKINLDICHKQDIRKIYENTFKSKYKKINFKFGKRKNYSYHLLKDYKLIFFNDSTLGYESLALGKKAVSCAYGSLKNIEWFRKKNLYRKITKFGHPEKFRNKGFFWINYFDASKIKRILNKTLKMPNKVWRKKNKKILDKIMVYDPKNKNFVNILKKYNISTKTV